MRVAILFVSRKYRKYALLTRRLNTNDIYKKNWQDKNDHDTSSFAKRDK